MRIFGFIVPPDLATQTPGETDSSAFMMFPRRLIAFDNEKYAVIDLEAQDDSEATKTLFNISTGIGGYMPRYISRRADAMEP